MGNQLLGIQSIYSFLNNFEEKKINSEMLVENKVKRKLFLRIY